MNEGLLSIFQLYFDFTRSAPIAIVIIATVGVGFCVWRYVLSRSKQVETLNTEVTEPIPSPLKAEGENEADKESNKTPRRTGERSKRASLMPTRRSARLTPARAETTTPLATKVLRPASTKAASSVTEQRKLEKPVTPTSERKPRRATSTRRSSRRSRSVRSQM